MELDVTLEVKTMDKHSKFKHTVKLWLVWLSWLECHPVTEEL